jgi:hypothetical protein
MCTAHCAIVNCGAEAVTVLYGELIPEQADPAHLDQLVERGMIRQLADGESAIGNSRDPRFAMPGFAMPGRQAG